MAELAPEGGTVWVHDYQLQLVPKMLRDARPDLTIGFFLHIPFPPVELFAQLPWRRQILEGLLGADLVGFQTADGARNFLGATRRLLGLDPGGDRVDVPDQDGHRAVRVGAFPIGIDAESFDAMARDPTGSGARPADPRRRWAAFACCSSASTALTTPRASTCGCAHSRRRWLRAFLDPSEVTMLQVAIPSRETVEEYRIIRDEIELLVGRINGDLGRVGDPAIHYLHQSVPREELVAMYVAADVLLVTPLRDGMNLVAKEYVASRVQETGAVVLSEFTGAAEQLQEAFIVNPYDIEGLKRTLAAVVASTPEELARRLQALRTNVFEDDVDRWVRTFLATLEGHVP